MRRIMRTVRLASSLGVTGALLVGCGLLGGAKNGNEAVPGMDMQGAAERADGMFYATVGAIQPGIEWVHYTTTTGSCDVTRYWTVMTVVSEQRRGNFLGVVERSWKASDFRIKTVNPSKEMPSIIAVSKDGFGIMVKFGYKGQAFFEVTSPCVDESKVAAPTQVATGRTYDGRPPTPNVRSDFWSAETPVPGPAPSS
ncbi:hypothetical protein PZ61_0215210 [Streptomyces sp. MNU77]|uniref:hypothetical protein n=1 Tax=unclassified Streptomyces TaxID=2593676 RepID=UPI0005E8D706|nr:MULTISPECIES: hypothetical protein [unclassified Streptomyces]OLO31758.1 hypothetical protein PZ61_0215210 [Streptomyces sp. MNU77]OWA23325.1 hypothetical protein B9W61_15835 [Streptomyces sp. CS057]